MANMTLNVGDGHAGLKFIPTPIKVLGGNAKLDNESTHPVKATLRE
jgi:hypothetical protein